MSVSNNVLHRYGMLCVDDLVVIDGELIGMITDTDQTNDNFRIKDVDGNVGMYSRQHIKLATSKEVESALQQLIFTL